MKKIIILFLPFIIWGCQKDFNSTVDVNLGNYEVLSVPTADSFGYVASDSLMTAAIALSNSNNVEAVTCNLFSPDGMQINIDPIQLFDNGNLSANGDAVKGDNIFSNKIPLSHYYAKGSYAIRFYVTDIYGNTKLAALHYFNYDNGQANVAPVISNLVAPDTVALGQQTTLIFLSVDAHDDNGANDIQSVFFNSYLPPDGHPSSANPFIMYDDGTNGDKVAGDGIYSVR